MADFIVGGADVDACAARTADDVIGGETATTTSRRRGAEPLWGDAGKDLRSAGRRTTSCAAATATTWPAARTATTTSRATRDATRCTATPAPNSSSAARKPTRCAARRHDIVGGQEGDDYVEGGAGRDRLWRRGQRPADRGSRPTSFAAARGDDVLAARMATTTSRDKRGATACTARRERPDRRRPGRRRAQRPGGRRRARRPGGRRCADRRRRARPRCGATRRGRPLRFSSLADSSAAPPTASTTSAVARATDRPVADRRQHQHGGNQPSSSPRRSAARAGRAVLTTTPLPDHHAQAGRQRRRPGRLRATDQRPSTGDSGWVL